MPIPDYQTIMLPLLRLAHDGDDHSINDAIEILASEFSLTNEEKSRLIPSGSPKFYNRVSWAKTHLKKAGLLEYPERGYFKITKRGLDILADNPSKINMAYLKQFPEFVAFRQTHHKDEGEEESIEEDDKYTPDEALEIAYQKIRNDLADELLETIISSPPAFFEKLVVDLLVAMGYGGTHRDASRAVGGVGDGGIDGIIDEDRLGLESIYIQAKRWQRTSKVSRPQVQSFVGALTGNNSNKGVFITTSDFTNEARSYVSGLNLKVILINGERLANLMIDYGIGVTTRIIYEIKNLDYDYFSVET